MRTLKEFESGDGAHCGLTDLYPEKEAALVAALKSGKPFDTGWFSSKKEIASARVWSDNKYVHCEASVSDDFDTEGMGSAIAGAAHEAKDIADVYSAIDRAWDEAIEAQKDNQQYRGYSLIHYSTKIPEWRKADNVYPKEKRKRYARKMPQFMDYYIVPSIGADDLLDSPPGDAHHFWGWQNDCRENMEGEGSKCVEDGIPESTVAAFEKFASECGDGSMRIGDWEIKAWED